MTILKSVHILHFILVSSFLQSFNILMIMIYIYLYLLYASIKQYMFEISYCNFPALVDFLKCYPSFVIFVIELNLDGSFSAH